MSLFDDDLSFITGDVFSSPVVFGSQSTRGVLTITDAGQPDSYGFIREERRTTLDLPSSALTGLVPNVSVLTVDGVQYQYRDSNPSVDGRQSTLILAKVE